MATRDCDHCRASYTRPPALLGKYCSNACGYAARRKPEVKPGQYRMLYWPRHPLAAKAKYIPEHRVLLWERIGAGPHPCHYCGASVDWMPGSRTKQGALVVDHKDRDSTNNDPANLVPCCQGCNNKNSAYKVTEGESHRARKNGTRLRGETRSCERCGGEFVAWPDPRPGRGRFCSRSCARRGPKTPAA